MVDEAKLPRRYRDFDQANAGPHLNCDAVAIKPRVDFGFRFQSGYILHIPMKQFLGRGHHWAIVARVTPAGGTPVYLLTGISLPNIPKNNVTAEIGGSYLLGEGRYSVDLMLLDDASRACVQRFKVEAKRHSGDHNMTLRIPPATVWALGTQHPAATTDMPREPLRRLTVLVHAAPVFPRSNRLRAWDREMLLGTLGSLLEMLPARSVRLVLFNLDQQRTLLTQEGFRPEELDKVSQAMNGLELGTVDYSVLQNPAGYSSLLAGLINAELRATERSDAVVFLCPPSRYLSKFPQGELEERSVGDPPFYYVQYRPYIRRGAEFADLVENAVKAVKGRTLRVHTPGEFAGAIQKLSAQ
jgi:hypothetical protein